MESVIGVKPRQLHQMAVSTNPSLGGCVIQWYYLWGYSKNYWGFQGYSPFHFWALASSSSKVYRKTYEFSFVNSGEVNVAYGGYASEGTRSWNGFNGATAAVDGSWTSILDEFAYDSCTASDAAKPWYDPLKSNVIRYVLNGRQWTYEQRKDNIRLFIDTIENTLVQSFYTKLSDSVFCLRCDSVRIVRYDSCIV